MDTSNLSLADKYLLYGLLLKKKRSPAEERKLVPIIRSSLDLDERIEAIMKLTEKDEKKESRRRRSAETPGASGSGKITKKKMNALVVDVHSELTRLLKKCSLKRLFVFTRIGESFDAIHLLRRMQVRLIILNENLADDEYPRYFEICRAVQPAIRIIYLGSAPRSLPSDAAFRDSTRFVNKPISITSLEQSARELLESGY